MSHAPVYGCEYGITCLAPTFTGLSRSVSSSPIIVQVLDMVGNRAGVSMTAAAAAAAAAAVMTAAASTPNLMAAFTPTITNQGRESIGTGSNTDETFGVGHDRTGQASGMPSDRMPCRAPEGARALVGSQPSYLLTGETGSYRLVDTALRAFLYQWLRCLLQSSNLSPLF